ncbi:uncharacterized protein LOC126743786 [Anthonomus grandis grandis]|uniref:uncharacterized protein LOC126743786 n=1 Tax=Anthonomus grandis grandis TaxID=2921223 RepID=UPI002166433A|nr:uncharacterized protein LOC126743786 [Anthonomus grandis grandis]
MLVPFRGRCGFRMYIPKKPAKYGIKVQVLADAKTHYLIDAEIYAGSEIKVDGAKKPTLSNPTRVVLRLVECVKGTNRNITGDNWYRSVELVDKRGHLTYVGTLRKNKKSVPPEFLPNRKCAIHSSTFGFTSSTTIVSYVPKKSKSVILFSSMRHDNSVNETTKKPEIIPFSNETKFGVEALDAKCALYLVSRRTNRWPMAIFFAILNIAGVNSRVLYQFASKEWPTRKCTQMYESSLLNFWGFLSSLKYLLKKVKEKVVPYAPPIRIWKLLSSVTY